MKYLKGWGSNWFHALFYINQKRKIQQNHHYLQYLCLMFKQGESFSIFRNKNIVRVNKIDLSVAWILEKLLKCSHEEKLFQFRQKQFLKIFFWRQSVQLYKWYTSKLTWIYQGWYADYNVEIEKVSYWTLRLITYLCLPLRWCNLKTLSTL